MGPRIEEAECGDLGIVPVDPPLSLAASAAVERRAGLSFYDHLCLLLAQENGWRRQHADGSVLLW